MKKKIVISLGAFALLAAAGLTSFQKADSGSSLLVRNIEALAGDEEGFGKYDVVGTSTDQYYNGTKISTTWIRTCVEGTYLEECTDSTYTETY